MIETIFYFAKNKTEYDYNANNGNISERTISFVPTGNGVGDIYKDGIKYGSSIDEDELIRIINKKIADGNFNIPFASTSKAGIIKLGKGLKSVGNDGTVDVDFTGLNGIDGLDGLIESILKTIINKNGTGVVVTPRSLSGSTVAIADIQVGNNTKTIYAPAGSGSGSGGGQSVQKTEVSVNPVYSSSSQNTKIATITVDGSVKELWIPNNSGSGTGESSDSGKNYEITTFDSTSTGIKLQQTNGINKTVDLTSVVRNIVGDGTSGDGGNGKNYEITDFDADGTLLTISQNNNTDTSVDIEDAVKQSIQNFIDRGDTIVNNFGEKTSVEVTQLINTGTEIAKITIDNGKPISLWAPAGGSGGSDNNYYYENDYDDSWIQPLLDKIDSDIADIKNGVIELHNQNYEEAINNFNTAYNEWKSFKQGYFTTDGWKFNEDAKAWVLQQGYIGENSGTWSTLTSKVDSIQGRVDGVVDSDGKLKLSESQFKTWLDKTADGNYIANALMDTQYTESDDDGNVLKYLISGFRSYAKDGTAVASLFADSSEGAIAAVQAKVTDIEGHIANVRSSFEALMPNGNFAGGYSKADWNSAITALFAEALDEEGNIVKGKIAVAVENGISEAVIDADKIAITGDTFVNKLATNSAFINTLTSNKAFISKLNVDQELIGYYQSQKDGFYWEIVPYSTFASMNLTNGSATYMTLGGSSTGTGEINVYYPSRGSATNITGGLVKVSNSGKTAYMGVTGGNPLIRVENGSRYASLNVDSSDVYLMVNDGSSWSSFGARGTTGNSDMRLKDVIADKSLTAELIASAPIFTYTPKLNPDSDPLIGTSAQYWQEVMPEVVSELNGYLALDYTKIATASVINLAKEVVTLKSENTALKQRVEALEARLQLIENKLNAQ